MTTEEMNAWFDKRFAEKMADSRDGDTPRLSIMVTKGTLDWAYPPFIIASTAAAMGWNATLFFTFYGLALLKKDLTPHVSPLGNPAMPMKAEVNLVACQMTVDLFGWKQEDFIPEISEWAGAATYLSNAKGADITLFV